MDEDTIFEIGIDEGARLYVRPTATSFDYIYREAMEVHWDEAEKRLYAPRPREWTYLRWFKQILAASEAYGVRLKLTEATAWSNISNALRAEISGTSQD